MYQLLLLRYGELGLKGKNKNIFIHKLQKNIENALRDLPPRKVVSTWGRIMVPLQDDMESVIERLQKVFGIYSMSPVLQVEKSLTGLQQGALTILKEVLPHGGTFKVETRRADKNFPMLSPDISLQVANYLFDQIDDRYDADLHHPQKTIHLEIRDEGAYVYGDTIAGAKGMPVGTGSKAVVLLSGGIDSPVAFWYGLKRGVDITAVHFHSFPFTSERAKEKVVDLCKEMAKWHCHAVKLYTVHFTEIQKEIRALCPENYGITIMRRMMFRIAQKIAQKEEALAIYTGESVGQVASQTLESMYCIGEVTDMPVLRPLVGMDKEEIMEIAHKIGTYDISIRPYEDCCTIFLPTFPKIRPKREEARDMEKALPIEQLIEEALAKTEVLFIQEDKRVY